MTPWLFICAAVVAVDGDTLRGCGERIRLRNVNAPELSEPGGREAKAALARLVDGREVRCVVFAKDRWGRLVGECGTDAVPSLDAAMVASGLAVPRRRGR